MMVRGKKIVLLIKDGPVKLQKSESAYMEKSMLWVPRVKL